MVQLIMLTSHLSIKDPPPHLLIFLLAFLEALASSVLQAEGTIRRLESVILDAVRVPLQDRATRLLRENDVLLDVLFEGHVRNTGRLRLIHHDAFARGLDVVIHTEISGATMYKHTLVA